MPMSLLDAMKVGVRFRDLQVGDRFRFPADDDAAISVKLNTRQYRVVEARQRHTRRIAPAIAGMTFTTGAGTCVLPIYDADKGVSDMPRIETNKTTIGRVTRSCAECGTDGLTSRCTRCGATEVCRTCGELYREGGDGFDDECPSCADKTDAKLNPEEEA